MDTKDSIAGLNGAIAGGRIIQPKVDLPKVDALMPMLEEMAMKAIASKGGNVQMATAMTIDGLVMLQVLKQLVRQTDLLERISTAMLTDTEAAALLKAVQEPAAPHG